MKSNGKIYALKILKKSDFEEEKSRVENVITERNIMMKNNHPFILKLRYSFQNE